MKKIKTVLLLILIIFVLKQEELIKKIDHQRDVANEAFQWCLKSKN